MPDILDSPPVETPPVPTPAPVDVSSAPDPFDGREFDPSQLDPARLMGKLPAEPVKAAEPTPEPVKPAEPVVPEPTKPGPVNYARLRELREAAEKDRDTFKTERDALAAKLAELEPKATTFETERETLRKQSEEQAKALQDVRSRLFRTAAAERPDWQENANKIRFTATEVEKIADLQELKDAGINVSAMTLLDPSEIPALNETVRILQEGGKLFEADTLLQAHRSVNALRGTLRAIEADAAKERETWQANQTASVTGVIKGVRDELAQISPLHNMQSPEYMALSKEDQEFMQAQHNEAATKAQTMLGLADQPDRLVAEAYKAVLGMNFAQKGLAQWQARGEAMEKELAALRDKVSAYEKAAGGGGSLLPSGGRASAPDPEDPAEVARMLDPKNLSGYRGL